MVKTSLLTNWEKKMVGGGGGKGGYQGNAGLFYVFFLLRVCAFYEAGEEGHRKACWAIKHTIYDLVALKCALQRAYGIAGLLDREIPIRVLRGARIGRCF